MGNTLISEVYLRLYIDLISPYPKWGSGNIGQISLSNVLFLRFINVWTNMTFNKFISPCIPLRQMPLEKRIGHCCSICAYVSLEWNWDAKFSSINPPLRSAKHVSIRASPCLSFLRAHGNTYALLGVTLKVCPQDKEQKLRYISDKYESHRRRVIIYDSDHMNFRSLVKPVISDSLVNAVRKAVECHSVGQFVLAGFVRSIGMVSWKCGILVFYLLSLYLFSRAGVESPLPFLSLRELRIVSLDGHFDHFLILTLVTNYVNMQ